MRVRRLGLIWLMAMLGLLTALLVTGSVRASWAFLTILPLTFVCELVDSSLGMGYGTTLSPLLVLLGHDPKQVVPAILISELCTGAAASFFHSEAGNVDFSRGSKHRRAALILSACGVIGVLVGAEVAARISRAGLTRLIGFVVLGAGVAILLGLRRGFVYRTWKLVALAVVASFNKVVSGGGYGPLLMSGQVLSGIEGRAAVGITSFAEAFTCLVGTVLFLARGGLPSLHLLLPVVAGALLSVPLSAQIVKRWNALFIERAIAWGTIALGILAVAKSLR